MNEAELIAERRHLNAEPRSPERTAALKKISAQLSALANKSTSNSGDRYRLQRS